MQINPENLSDDQLEALAIIDPVAAHREKIRRAQYGSVSEGLSDLHKAHFRLITALDNMNTTKAKRAIIDSGITTVVERLLSTAEREGHKFEQPTI